MILLIYCIWIIFPYPLLCNCYKTSSLPILRKYANRSYIGVLLLDYISKLIGATLLCVDYIDEDTFMAYVIVPPIITCIAIYLLDKFYGPHIEHRKIQKIYQKSKISASTIICFILFILNPLFTIELYLIACGFDGISGYYQMLPILEKNLDSEDLRAIEQFGLGLIITLIFYLLLVIYLIYTLFTRKERKKEGFSISEINSTEAPILFLRSFELNKSAISTKTFDEYLCSGFPVEKQPVISLADPDTAFTGGSIKLQADDALWKEAIVKLFQYSKAVIMFEGKSDGLNWEIDNIKKYVDYNRFFIATPSDDYRTVAWVVGNIDSNNSLKIQIWWAKKFTKKSITHAFDFIWSNFSKRLKSAGINLPSQQPGSGTLISFDRNWRANHIYQGLSKGDFLKKILSLIPSEDNIIFDYSEMQNILKEYEVKETLSSKTLFKCKRLSILIISIEIILFIIIFIYSLLLMASVE